jgi:hypothetical protein
MGKVRTSASFYRRGVPNDFHSFGYFTQANYPIVQPQYGIIYLLNNKKTNVISRFNKYIGVNLYNAR